MNTEKFNGDGVEELMDKIEHHITVYRFGDGWKIIPGVDVEQTTRDEIIDLRPFSTLKEALQGCLEHQLFLGVRTKYRGIVFESRLEARWAAFFNLVNWEWTYRPLSPYGLPLPAFLLSMPGAGEAYVFIFPYCEQKLKDHTLFTHHVFTHPATAAHGGGQGALLLTEKLYDSYVKVYNKQNANFEEFDDLRKLIARFGPAGKEGHREFYKLWDEASYEIMRDDT